MLTAPVAPVDPSGSPTLPSDPEAPHRRPPTGTSVTCWVFLVPLGVVALLRVVAWDDFQPFAVLNTVTAFIYLPAWIVLVVALLSAVFLVNATKADLADVDGVSGEVLVD